MRFVNKISSIDDKQKKFFFNRLLKKLKNNNLLDQKLHLIIGSNIFENSFFKNDNLLKCLNNYKKKNFFFVTFLNDFINFVLIISKILIFKVLTPKNKVKKIKKKIF